MSFTEKKEREKKKDRGKKKRQRHGVLNKK